MIGYLAIKQGKIPSEKKRGDMVIDGERFIFSDLTAEDKETGLIWMRDTFSGWHMCWSDAKQYITDLNRQIYAGYNDWRLPTNKELQTLLCYPESQGHNSLLFGKIGFKNVKSGGYWSSTFVVIGMDQKMLVVVWEGGEMTRPDHEKGCRYCVWPVRFRQ